MHLAGQGNHANVFGYCERQKLATQVRGMQENEEKKQWVNKLKYRQGKRQEKEGLAESEELKTRQQSTI